MRILALLGLVFALPASAATITLDFAEEALGSHGESFVSAECSCATLTALDSPRGTEEQDLSVVDFAGSRALVVGDEGGALDLEFVGISVVAVEIEFGSAGFEEQRPVVLIALSGGAVLSWASVVADGTIAPDQTLGVSKTGRDGFRLPIDSIYFDGTQLGESEPESALVGRIVLTTVPEPAVALLIAPAVLACAPVRRFAAGRER